MNMVSITDELDKFQKEQRRLDGIKEFIKQDLYRQLDLLERSGKKPEMVYDTYVEFVADENNLKIAEAYKIVNSAISERCDIMNTNRTTIFLYTQIRCKCGAKYSNKLKLCPGCKTPFDDDIEEFEKVKP